MIRNSGLKYSLVIILAFSFLFIPVSSYALFFGGRVTQIIPKGTTPPAPATPCPVDQYVIVGFFPAIIIFPSGAATGAPRIGKYAAGIYVPAPLVPCGGSNFIMAGFSR